MNECTFNQCLPICASGIAALLWTAWQEMRIRNKTIAIVDTAK